MVHKSAADFNIEVENGQEALRLMMQKKKTARMPVWQNGQHVDKLHPNQPPSPLGRFWIFRFFTEVQHDKKVGSFFTDVQHDKKVGSWAALDSCVGVPWILTFSEIFRNSTCSFLKTKKRLKLSFEVVHTAVLIVYQLEGELSTRSGCGATNLLVKYLRCRFEVG